MLNVDVLLPIRNPNITWLTEALDSLQIQEGVRVRLIAVVDRRDPGVRDLFKSLSIEVVIVEEPEAGNISDALNVGLSICEAPLIARMDADDICEPTRLTSQANYMEANPEVAVTTTSVTIIDGRGRPVGFRRAPRSEESLIRRLRWKCVVNHPSTMMRLETIKRLGGYNSSAAGAEDYDLWLRVLQAHRIVPLDTAMLRYRVHSDQSSKVRAVSTQCMEAIRDSRLALAEARNESLLAARLRQFVWAERQRPRRWMRD